MNLSVGGYRGFVPHNFAYGKDNGGLYEIQRVSSTSSKIVTRVKGYGGSTNIPKKYKKEDGSILPSTQYIPSLMLPDYEFTGIDYIDSKNTSIYGIKEGIFRDESIYPSISGVTASQLIASGIPVTSTGRIDEIVKMDDISTEDQAQFNIYIKDIGFDINDYLSPQPAIVSMKDGNLGGVEFEVVRCVLDSSVEGAKYKLTLNRNTDDTFTLPDTVTKIKSGDHFVLLQIYMPPVYVKAAEQKLKEACLLYLSQNDSAKVTYSIGLSEIFIAKNKYLEDYLFEGMSLHVFDQDLGINRDIVIQTITINDDYNSDVKSFSVILSDEPVATAFMNTQKEVVRIIDNFTENKQFIDRNIRRNVISLNGLRDRVFDTDGYFDNTNLRPNSIETLYLSVGAKSSNFILLANIIPNYEGDPNKIALTDGILVHREIRHGSSDIDENYIWNIGQIIINDLDPDKAYYIYAKCRIDSSIAEWFISDQMIRYDDDTFEGYYYFKLGSLFNVEDGVRGDAMEYGKTWINGRFITTGVIQSAYGSEGSYWDLDQDKMKVGKGSYMDFGITKENALTLFDVYIKNKLYVEGEADFAGWLISNFLIKSKDEVNIGTESAPNMKPKVSLDGINNVIELYSKSSGGDESLDTNSGSHIRLNPDSGIVEVRAISSGRSKVSYMSPSGIFSNNAGTNAVSATTGLTRMAAIVGLGNGSLASGIWNNENFIAGVYGTASNALDAPAFGGYFNDLKAAGFILNTMYVSDSTSGSNLDINTTTSLVIGLVNSGTTKSITLPADVAVGRTIIVKMIGTGTVRVLRRDGFHIFDDSSENAYYDAGNGDLLIFHFCKFTQTTGEVSTNMNAWVVSKVSI